MKFVSVLLPFIVLLETAFAQQEFLQQLPQCAVRCLEATLPTSSCSPSDFGCLCADQQFMDSAAACNSMNCTVVEVLQATNATLDACGVPVRDQSATLVGVPASFGSVAILMVIMRLFDRAFSGSAQLGWDDLLIGLSGFVSLFMNVPVIVAARLGFGKDMWGIPADNISESLKWLYVAYFSYMATECFCQASILAFYVRIMVDKTMRKIVWGLFAIVIAFGIANTVAMIFQCTPISFFWDGWKGQMEGFCGVDTQLFGFAKGGIQIFLDLAILSLPLPMLAKLNMSPKKKLQIMSMFCVGFVITVVSCMRIWSFVQFAASQNPTYDNTSGLYWCATEANLFIIVACMPAIHAIAHKTLRKARGLPTTYASGDRYGSNQLSKSDQLRYNTDKKQRSGSLPFGVITKSTDVNVYNTQRSSSDIELVDRERLPQ